LEVQRFFRLAVEPGLVGAILVGEPDDQGHDETQDDPGQVRDQRQVAIIGAAAGGRWGRGGRRRDGFRRNTHVISPTWWWTRGRLSAARLRLSSADDAQGICVPCATGTWPSFPRKRESSVFDVESKVTGFRIAAARRPE